MSFRVILLSLLSITFGLLSCQDEIEEPKDVTFGTSYYPVRQGQFQTFSVRQTRFALNESPQTTTYQLKEVIGEEFDSEGGEVAYEILRFDRPNGLEVFTLDSVFSLRKDDDRLIKTEHNVPYVKMNFPLEEGKTWNGNQFNGRTAQDYLVEEVGVPKQIGNTTFPRTLTIYESQDSSLTEKNLRYEIYADSIGLVYKYTESLIYCTQPDCFGQKIIERGIISELTIFDWGVE